MKSTIKLRAWLASAAVCASLLASSARANAAYDARGNELKVALQNAKVTDPQELATLQKLIDDWTKQRSDLLDQLVAVIAETSPDKVQQTEFRTRAHNARDALASTFDSAMKALPGTPSVAAMAFINLTRLDEDSFFKDLDEKSNIGADRDWIVTNQKNVASMKSDLEKKWSATTDSEKSLSDAEQSMLKDVESTLSSVIDAATAKNATFRERVYNMRGDLIKLAGMGVGAASFDSQAAQIIADCFSGLSDPFSDWIGAVTGEHNLLVSRTQNFRSLIDSRSAAIYPMFVTTRRDTQDFIDKNGFPVAKLQWQVAKDEMETWAGHLPTSGQQTDGRELKDNVLSKLSDHLKRTEDTFNDFVSSNQSRFFGPISQQTLNGLTDGTAFSNEWNRVDRMQFDAKLREWRRLTSAWWDVDVSSLPPSARAKMKQQFDSRMNELFAAFDQTLADIVDLVKAEKEREDADKQVK